jgi:hypothetical protein
VRVHARMQAALRDLMQQEGDSSSPH